MLDLSAFEIEESTRTVSPADLGEVTLTSYLAVHGRPKEHDQPLPVQFGVSEAAAHAFGILAMPNPDALGQNLNPLAEQPFQELLLGERGRQFLSQTEAVDTPEFEWAAEPTRLDTREVELMGTATTAESYHSIATDGDDSRTILAILARVENEGDVVLVGEFLWRATPAEPLEERQECTDERCQLSGDTLERIGEQFNTGTPHVTTCPEWTNDPGAPISACSGVSEVPDTGPVAKMGITDVRVVQYVEDTQVVGTGSPVRVFHEEPDPDLVRGDNSAVVFEFDTLEHLDEMGTPLELVVFSGNPGSGSRYEREGTISFSQYELRRIKNGADTVAVLHDISAFAQLSDTSTRSSGNPVFDLENGDVRVAPAVDSKDTSDAWATLNVPSDSIRDVKPLKVGVIALRDDPTNPLKPRVNLAPGDRYGTANGTVRDRMRSFRSLIEYLQRAYPGDVVGYLHTDSHFPGRADEGNIRGEMGKVQNTLDNIATGGAFSGPSFPSGGTLDLDGRDRSTIVNDIKQHGFDITVAIVPAVAAQNPNAGSYFAYHGEPDWSGVAFGPGQAVVVNGASSGGTDTAISSVGAQEVGHFFQDDYLGPTYQNQPDHPMAQRRDPPDPLHKMVNGLPLDKDHARDQNSSHDGVSDDDPDEPGVLSVGYDLADGFETLQHYENPDGNFEAQDPGETHSCGQDTGCQTVPRDTVGRVPSYMSYTGRDDRVWTDARVHQQLIESGASGWDTGLFGSGDATYMLSASGSVDDDGGVQYDSVTAFEGYRRYVNDESNPVTVTLEDPNGEALVSAQVPVSVPPTHGTGEQSGGRGPDTLLPFEPDGVRVRTEYDGQTTTMNPIVRSVRDAVRRVPEQGFSSGLEPGRASVDEALSDVAAAMDRGEYDRAATLMDEQVRTRIRENVREYDAALDQRTPAAMDDLVDRMVERLDAAGGSG